ncbi:cancer-related nucleoside-triphosphatase homolog [Morus notabilis]|uniref:cancer-related nucleoside-triphosphatase homolog n=1 Tax=Morus notabilis TaxID=981085 RepID=UPI000CED2488|nr:cancer-related nucleoside-triphosphatase homolog [Morus notabilis]
MMTAAAAAAAAAAGSGKCLLVTGPPGIGKTTLIIKAFESLKASNPSLKLQGFYTREIRQGSERVGFEVVTLDGHKAPLATTSSPSPECLRWPTVGRYKVDVASFESLALPQLQVREDTDLFVIDEVGKMELYSSSFFPAVLKVLESNIPILATVPIPKSGRDIPGVARLKNHPGASIYALTASNRDAIKDQIYSQLVDLLRKK